MPARKPLILEDGDSPIGDVPPGKIMRIAMAIPQQPTSQTKHVAIRVDMPQPASTILSDKKMVDARTQTDSKGGTHARTQCQGMDKKNTLTEVSEWLDYE